jgi:phosphoribosylamine-glycine ligase
MKGDLTNRSGEGIVPVTHNLAQWLAWGNQDPSTVYFFDMTKSGELADQLRKAGKNVVGAGKFQDRLEMDRGWGEDIAKSVGILCPPTKEFSTISAAIAWLETNPKQEHGDGGWAFKVSKDIGCDTTLVAKDNERLIDHMKHVVRRNSDSLKCIIQEKIDGVAVSTGRWWNGWSWVGPYEGTIENKKLMNDNLGPSTGCSFCVVWFYTDDNPKIAEDLKWEELAAVFRKNDAPAGLYDINAILNDKGAWFLEWTPRLGIDSEIASQRGIKYLGQFLYNLVMGRDVEAFFDKKQSYFDVTLSVPPYFIHEVQKGYKSPAVGVPVKGIDGLTDGNFVMGGLYFEQGSGFHVGEPTGNLGFLVGSGTSLKKGFQILYDWCKENLVIPDLQYRTDAAAVLQKDLDEMKKHGFETSIYLRK